VGKQIRLPITGRLIPISLTSMPIRSSAPARSRSRRPRLQRFRGGPRAGSRLPRCSTCSTPRRASCRRRTASS
jgi:hypothetical protein